MKKRNKFLAVILGICLVAALLCACGTKKTTEEGSAEKDPASVSKETFTVGICQLVQHPALDEATQGFKDELTEQLGSSIIFDEANAAGDSATCATICNGFVAEGVDLIMANATPALQAAASATDKIPVLGTSVTTYDAALNLTNFTGTVGGNISGTSDLSPLDQQAAMVKELFPNAKNVAILFCSSEVNSVYQADVIEAELTKLGMTVTRKTFADSNDVALVTQEACTGNDVIFIPTDNTAASCAEAIDAVAREAKVPIITGDEGICKTCGVATLTIDYYELGKVTGKMAAKILLGEADVSEMAIEYFQNPVKKVNKELADLYKVTVPADYEEIVKE